jgi:hypothetical protein
MTTRGPRFSEEEVAALLDLIENYSPMAPRTGKE